MIKKASFIFAVLATAGISQAAVIASWDNNNMVAGDSAAKVDKNHPKLKVSKLEQEGFQAGDWNNGYAIKGLWDNSLAGAVSADRYYTVTAEVKSGYKVSFSAINVEGTMAANLAAASVDVTLMSSVTGFSTGNALGTVSLSIPAGTVSKHFHEQVFDLSNVLALQNVEPGTEVEFRLYVHNTGANNMIRFSIGHAGYTAPNAGGQDFEIRGTVIDPNAPAPAATPAF